MRHIRVIELKIKVSSCFPLLLFLLSAPVSLLSQSGASPATPSNSLRILDQWKLSEPGSWGHLNFEASANRLYIPRTGNVSVVDTATGKLLGKVPGFVDARAVALDDTGRFGYATDMLPGSTGYVRVFDRATLQVVASIAIGRVPSAIVFDPVTKTVFAFSTSQRNAAVIDTATNTVAKTIPLPGKPHLALTDGKGSIYVSFRGIGKLVRIDTASRAIAATWPTDPCAEFHGLTFDAGRRLLIGSCYPKQLITIGADNGEVHPAGESPLDAMDLAFDPRHHFLISGSASGSLSLYREDSPMHFTLERQLPTSPRAGTIAVDPGKGRVYLVTSDFGPAPEKPGMEESEAQQYPLAGTFRVIVASF
jgi:DNA-binding beta-propeller fold protein YncE